MGECFDEEFVKACLSLENWPFDVAHLSRLKPEWRVLAEAFLASPQGQSLERFLRDQVLAKRCIYPPEPLRLLELLGAEESHVVILGQDPYHGWGQAEGLAFSVAKGVRMPPSLRNIFKELERDVQVPMPQAFEASLLPWVKRGVFLLNHVLSVEQGRAASHLARGWEVLTNAIVLELMLAPGPRVFMLWGSQAQKQFDALHALKPHAKGSLTHRLVLRANHPSPLSALRGDTPFMGCAHFSKAQQWLSQAGVHLEWGLRST